MNDRIFAFVTALRDRKRAHAAGLIADILVASRAVRRTGFALTADDADLIARMFALNDAADAGRGGPPADRGDDAGTASERTGAGRAGGAGSMATRARPAVGAAAVRAGRAAGRRREDVMEVMDASQLPQSFADFVVRATRREESVMDEKPMRVIDHGWYQPLFNLAKQMENFRHTEQSHVPDWFFAQIREAVADLETMAPLQAPGAIRSEQPRVAAGVFGRADEAATWLTRLMIEHRMNTEDAHAVDVEITPFADAGAVKFLATLVYWVWE